MKRILILSDSHGNKDSVENLIMGYKFDCVFFLGDGIKDFEWLNEEEYNIIKVAGNCDYFSTESKVRVEVVDGIRILLTHGDLFGVKYSICNLLKEAKLKNIDVVCFGHTHNQIDEIEDNIRLLNPGAFKNGHYMILEIDKSQLNTIKI